MAAGKEEGGRNEYCVEGKEEGSLGSDLKLTFCVLSGDDLFKAAVTL